MFKERHKNFLQRTGRLTIFYIQYFISVHIYKKETTFKIQTQRENPQTPLAAAAIQALIQPLTTMQVIAVKA